MKMITTMAITMDTARSRSHARMVPSADRRLAGGGGGIWLDWSSLISRAFIIRDGGWRAWVTGLPCPLAYAVARGRIELMLRIVCLLAAGAVAALPAEAPRKAFPYAYDQHDFANGLRLVTIPTDYPNVVSVYIVVQTGSRNEIAPGKSGFAHLF